MTNTIILIESPNKCEKIAKITGAKVYATKGHFKELSKQIVKDYENYEPIFEFKLESKSRINSIFNDCKGKDVVIATDPDREGYAIGYMVYDTIKNIAKSVKRAEFHEITESGIKKGLDNAIPFSNSNLKEFEAFKARVVGDKLVGFILSPKYINKLNDKNNSVGRVQTPALSLIVKRELEIQEFNKNKANAKIDYKIKAKLQTNKGVEFFALNDNVFSSKEEAEQKIADLKDASAQIYDIQTKNTQIKPKEPYRTSQLQESANKVLGLSSDKTMSTAQKLFEKGLITYHRTDSNALSKEFIDEVEKEFKNNEWYEKREYKAGDQSQAQAHEAIRVSHIHQYSKIDEIAKEEKLSDDEKALYELIFLNSIQSQAKNEIKENTTYDINIKVLSFKTKTSKTIYKGFKEAIKQIDDNDETQQSDQESQNIQLNKDDELKIMGFELQEVKKQAPTHYKESNFISLLEKEGIGRPSTYAMFLPTLLKRDYIKIEAKGKNQNIVATSKGINFIQTIKNEDEWITKSEFTKDMETILDKIGKNESTYIEFIKVLHEKMGNKQLNQTQLKPPSPKQLEFAKKIAQNLKIDLPKDIENSLKICSDFIEKNKDKSTKPPSEKQLQWAKDIAQNLKIDLPKDIENSLKICSDFIEKNKGKNNNANR